MEKKRKIKTQMLIDGELVQACAAGIEAFGLFREQEAVSRRKKFRVINGGKSGR